MMRGNTTTTRRKRLKRFRKTPYPPKQGMSQQDTNANGDIVKDFQSTGRTGRRNALADVLGEHKSVSTSDLPLKLEKLSTNDSEESSSKQSCVSENQNSSSPSAAKDS